MLEKMGQVIEEFSKQSVFADIRHEVLTRSRMFVQNGRLRGFTQPSSTGTVARVLIGECWGQASMTREVTKERLKELLETAMKMAKVGSKHTRKEIDLSSVKPIEETVWQRVKEDPLSVSSEEKLELVMELDEAQKVDDKVVNTNSVYQDSKRVYHLVNTAGSRLAWDEIRTSVVVQPVVRDESQVHYDYDVKSGSAGYEVIREIDPVEFGGTCAHSALKLLSAEKPPSGKMKVIMDGDVSGLIAHEVCGHASEADEVVKERSFLTGMVGKKIATDMVTMIDDGTLEGPQGRIPFDCEGTPSSRTTIIENGVFSGYMHTLESAILMGVNPTGNGRAQDYNRRIFARMTNTFFDKGDWKNEEIIEDTKDGLYVIRATSGMEDVVGGGVQASALKGYIIKNGELTQLVRSMSLAGKVLDILQSVDAVGDILEFSGGTCGKGEEDWVSVSSGGPHMRAEIIVGGG
ncbi:MAG: hypothetical protein GF411_11510 [Candidatus Lokiarchaeota archaeon]|nr:hypothetical protein [Candidatus Lokiarchaeota archaeon]